MQKLTQMLILMFEIQLN